MRRWVVTSLVLLLVLVAVVTVVRWWQHRDDTSLQRAVAMAPADAQRLTFTDWAGVRRELGADLDAASSTGDLEDFLDTAFETDLSPMSALLESATTMQVKYGFSPATLEWELLTQSDEGAAVLMQLPDDADLDAVQDGLAELGYRRPDDDTGVWRGGIDLLPTIGGTLTPELQHLAVDADAGIVVASDTERYAATAIAAVTGDGDTLGQEGSLDDVVAAAGEPLAAAVYDADVACSSLAMGSADEGDQATADELVAEAGRVDPLTGFAMAAQPGGGVRVAMSFEDADEARANADSRSVLASGPAPGQGGDFADRFALGRVVADGDVVTMALEPREGEYLLSDLSSGPVLFATC
ncbi:hypothetical protein GCM10009623_13430 [Nocardioides aestuarii]|uniref:DUF3352 domain-containing protein n=1 Tax=Nocardioides aestuarii TaxID=252231 RepID=A0ABW4TJD3_9ACTN